jgi:arylsulfatase A-like enzyme
MRAVRLFALVVPALVPSLAAPGLAAPGLAASVLPQPDPPFHGKIAANRSQAVPDWPAPIKAPAGAPNIVLVLLDDVGFAAPGTFGGPAATPRLDQLAASGVRYNDFNTTAICSPTRASLLTGRNQHQVGFGNLQDVAAGFPGYNTIWHKSTASIAEVLRESGYSTAAFGKWHNTPIWEISPSGPFDHWPTGLGFEYFYGFLWGESSQWEPLLYRNTTPVPAPGRFDQGYHLTVDLVNDALHWVREHDAVTPSKPFFLYFATGATHAPHHVPKVWIDKYRGQFEQGWDKLREESFARQKTLGVIPADAELTPRPKELPAWDSLSADQKKLYARQMEVYAGFLSQTDAEVGRLLDGIKADGHDKDTLVLYVVGDNGGSAEGGLEGSDANLATFGGEKSDLASMLSHIDDLGSPYYDNHYAAGWSWATTAPFQWMKQIASHFGGTRDGFVVSWPGHTADPQAVRTQFAHVNDIAPTIYQAAGVTFPDEIDGAKQLPLEGRSLVATFTDPSAKTGHDEQYFEIFGNRAIYKDGWVAGARRYAPWELFTNPLKVFAGDPAKDTWELYHVATDFSEAHDLAASNPQKLNELKAEFDREAKRNDVYPLVPIPLIGVPSPLTGRTHFVYGEGVDRIPLAVTPDLTARAHRLTAEIEVPPQGGDGVIVAEGGRYGGFSLYVSGGKLVYENNTLGTVHERIISTAALPQGHAVVTLDFKPDAGIKAQMGLLRKIPGPGKATLLLNGQKVGETHFSKFGGFASSIDEPLDIGRDSGSPVSAAYQSPNPYPGRVTRVTIDLL